jgi:putative ABC transport system permease protein
MLTDLRAMSFFDLLSQILENLGRRKARVALTAIGVVIGTAAVVVLVSLAIGQQRTATEQLGGIGDLTQIQVMPNYGGGEGGPGVPAPVVVAPGGSPPTQKLITDDSLKELAALPGVVAVIPRDFLQAGGSMQVGKLEGYGQIMGVGTSDLSDLKLEAQSGTLALAKGTVIIGSQVPMQFYDPRQRPGQAPPPPPDLLDKDIKLTLFKYTQDGVESRKTVQVHVAGILTETRDWQGSDFSVFMPLDEVTAFNSWSMGRRVNRNRDGYPVAIVKMESVEQVLEAADAITALGYQASTPQSFVEGINSYFITQQVLFGGVGAISLLVAAIGIANTMTMSILERTREIGLMKAVGATNRDVLSIFLGEASGIGLLGGAGGVALGWSAGQIINVLALAYFAGQASQGQQFGPPPTTAVYTPGWLPVFALIFATVIGLLSGLYPALRAATLVPVVALKYE